MIFFLVGAEGGADRGNRDARDHPTNSNASANSPRQPHVPQSEAHQGCTTVNGVNVWTFEESRLNINGRFGSNACTFIAVYMAKLVAERNLKQPNQIALSNDWKEALINAITTENQLHDDFFEFDAVDVTVDQAVVMAGDQWDVDRIISQIDVFGRAPAKQLKSAFKKACETNPGARSHHILTAHGRTFLLAVFEDRSIDTIDWLVAYGRLFVRSASKIQC